MGRRRYGRKKNGISKLWVYLTIFLLFAVVFSTMASFSWFFDLFSHFVVQYTVISLLLAVLLLLSNRKVWALFALIIAATQAYQLAPYFQKSPESPERYDEVEILQYNVNWNNDKVDEMARWIISQTEDADILVLFEVNERWQDAIRRIKWAYPYHISKDMRGGRNMVIFSRMYVDEIEIKYLEGEKLPAVVIRGETTGYELPFVLYGVHPAPPVYPSYAKENKEILDFASDKIGKENIENKILLGDLNTTRFSPNFKKLEKKSGLRDSNIGLGLNAFRSSWPSLLPNIMGINIDNILVSDNIIVEKKKLGPALGSDHRPVMTTLKLMVPEGSKR